MFNTCCHFCLTEYKPQWESGLCLRLQHSAPAFSANWPESSQEPWLQSYECLFVSRVSVDTWCQAWNLKKNPRWVRHQPSLAQTEIQTLRRIRWFCWRPFHVTDGWRQAQNAHTIRFVGTHYPEKSRTKRTFTRSHVFVVPSCVRGRKTNTHGIILNFNVHSVIFVHQKQGRENNIFL